MRSLYATKKSRSSAAPFAWSMRRRTAGRALSQAVFAPEGRGRHRRRKLDADADDLAGRIDVEAAPDELDLLRRGKRERVGREEHLVEQRQPQRRLVVRGRVQHERDAPLTAASPAHVVQ